MEGGHWGFGDLPVPAESFSSVGRTYTVRQQHRRPMFPTYPHSPDAAPHPDAWEDESSGEGEGEGEFHGPVNVFAHGALISEMRRLEQQAKRGRVTASSEAAVLRLLREVSPTACSDDCCAICLEDFAAAADPPLRAMPSCSHAFHQHCILKWLRVNVVCPVCRCQLPLSGEGDTEDEEEQVRRSRVRRRVDEWFARVALHTGESQRRN